MNKFTLLIIFVAFNSVNIFSQSNEFPKIMYVNSIGGTIVYEEPTINSKAVGFYLHGQRIRAGERSTSFETINGVAEYWYENLYSGGWIFGGYLSEYIPNDVPVFLGEWDIVGNREYFFDVRNERIRIVFSPDYSYAEGVKETGAFAYGYWEQNGNIIKVTLNFIGDTIDDPVIDPPIVKIFQIDVVDRDNINFIISYDDNVFNRNNAFRLIRCNEFGDCPVCYFYYMY